MSILLDISLFQLAITFAAPLLIAATGEMIIERTGISNLSIEGMMAFAASVGFLASYYAGSNVVGLVAAMAAGALFGLILSYLAVYLRANQVIVGLGLLVLGTGLSSLLYRLTVGVRLIPPQIPILARIPLPVLGQIPVLGPILFQQPILVYLAYFLVPAVAFVLFKTPLGLRLRATGENPRAVDTLGIDVFKIRFWGTIVGAAIIGLGGAYLPMVLTGTFSEGMVGGRGWLSLMLVTFGQWQPVGITLGSFFFAYIEALQFRLAMTTKSIPSEFFLMLPYLAAIVALVRIYHRAEAPESLLKPYHREQRA